MNEKIPAEESRSSARDGRGLDPPALIGSNNRRKASNRRAFRSGVTRTDTRSTKFAQRRNANRPTHRSLGAGRVTSLRDTQGDRP